MDTKKAVILGTSSIVAVAVILVIITKPFLFQKRMWLHNYFKKDLVKYSKNLAIDENKLAVGLGTMTPLEVYFLFHYYKNKTKSPSDTTQVAGIMSKYGLQGA